MLSILCRGVHISKEALGFPNLLQVQLRLRLELFRFMVQAQPLLVRVVRLLRAQTLQLTTVRRHMTGRLFESVCLAQLLNRVTDLQRHVGAL